MRILGHTIIYKKQFFTREFAHPLNHWIWIWGSNHEILHIQICDFTKIMLRTKYQYSIEKPQKNYSTP
jgi:hypothetical protein